MALIYSIIGESEKAIDELEYLLTIPSYATPKFIRADPIFAPLQEIPRFKKILENYEAKNIH